MLACVVLSCFLALAYSETLRIGYPTVLSQGDETDLCKVNFEVPTGIKQLRVLADYNAVTLGTSSAVLYAAPGNTVDRSADHRITADQVGDTDVVIPNPVPGKWTLGVLSDCKFCVFGVTTDAHVSVTAYTDSHDPIIDMIEHFNTANVAVLEGRMGFFTFNLATASEVFFKITPTVTSKLDELHAYLRKDDLPDINDLNNGIATLQVSLTGTIELDGSIRLEPGLWTLGVLAKNVKGNLVPFQGGVRPSNFAVAYAVGTAPSTPDPEPLDICPTEAAPAETGDWDKCGLLNCQECVSDPECGFCRVKSVGKWDYSDCQRLDSTKKCRGEFELYPDALVTDEGQCSRCGALECDKCIDDPDCSWCATQVSFGNKNSTLFGCEDGVACKAYAFGIGVKPLVDKEQCSKPRSLINIGDLEFPDVSNFTKHAKEVIGDIAEKGYGPDTGNAPPVNSMGQILVDKCANSSDKCKEDCDGKGGVRSCKCSGSGDVTVVCKAGGATDDSDAAATTAASLLAVAVAASATTLA